MSETGLRRVLMETATFNQRTANWPLLPECRWVAVGLFTWQTPEAPSRGEAWEAWVWGQEDSWLVTATHHRVPRGGLGVASLPRQPCSVPGRAFRQNQHRPGAFSGERIGNQVIVSSSGLKSRLFWLQSGSFSKTQDLGSLCLQGRLRKGDVLTFRQTFEKRRWR